MSRGATLMGVLAAKGVPEAAQAFVLAQGFHDLEYRGGNRRAAEGNPERSCHGPQLLLGLLLAEHFYDVVIIPLS